MEYLTEELKTLIHHILFKHKFYRLEMKNYAQLLVLLQEDPTAEPRSVQECMFRGILNHNRRYRDNIAASLRDPRFDQVPSEAKQLMHRILHEFHFLYSIRAHEMFEPQYVQPGFNSCAQTGTQKAPLDDDLQRYKLHAMYYGPLSMYHLGMQPQVPFPNASMFSPPLANISQERSMFTDPKLPPSIFTSPVVGGGLNLGRSMFDEPSRPVGEVGLKLTPKQSRTNLDKQISGQRSMEIQRLFGGLRGRPSKQKKKLIQQLTSRRITPQLTELLTHHFGSSRLSQQRNDELQFCVCQGFITDNSQQCTVCHNRFHSLCQGRHQHCLDCRMKGRDPFNKLVETLGSFCIYDLENNKFEEQMNMKALENMCKKLGRFEVMISCIRAGDDDEICWPDDSLFCINGEAVFEIPALLMGHPTKRRKDTGYHITPYIFRENSEDSVALQKMKFSLEWKAVDPHPPRRNNRAGIFRLGFYVVEKITPNDLFEQILKLNKDVPMEKPFDKDEGQAEIDQLSVTYFDPFSLALIQTPTRGHLCKHLQCFDLQTFLAFTWASPERLWKCPFCGLDARRLIIDKYQLRILEDIKDMERPPTRVVYHRNNGIDFKDAGIEEESSRNSPDF